MISIRILKFCDILPAVMRLNEGIIQAVQKYRNHGFTQQETANLTGISFSSIYRIERRNKKSESNARTSFYFGVCLKPEQYKRYLAVRREVLRQVAAGERQKADRRAGGKGTTFDPRQKNRQRGGQQR